MLGKDATVSYFIIYCSNGFYGFQILAYSHLFHPLAQTADTVGGSKWGQTWGNGNRGH